IELKITPWIYSIYLYKSLDYGNNWSYVMAPSHLPTQYYDIETNENKVFVSLTGLYRSLDGGNVWSLITYREIRNLFSFDDFLLMGNDSLGILLLNDTSTTLIPFNDGLPNQFPMWVRDITIYNGYIYASIMCYNGPYGLWKRPLSDILYVNSVDNQVRIRVYPNPADTQLKIALKNNNLPADVSLYDIHGNLILSEKLIENERHIDVSDIAPGVYLLKVVGEKEVYTNKVIVHH
ncbi:MAG: T9SS type A sorting domain-containing protein, partial [Bacteroidota bacterium]